VADARPAPDGAADTTPESPTDPHRSRTLGGLTVVLDRAALRLTVFAPDGDDGAPLADIDLRQVGFRRADATFEMVFGMFRLTEEVLAPWARPSQAGPFAGSAPDVLAVPLLDDTGATLAEVAVRAGGDGHLVLTIDAVEDGWNRAAMALDCRPTDHFAGLGAHTHDVDFRGQRVPLFVSEQGIGKVDTNEYPVAWFAVGRRHTTHIPVPALVTSRGTAWALDTTAYSHFDLCATHEDRVTLEAWEGRLTWRLFAGPTPLAALGRMTAWTGRPALPPPWAFAPWNDAIYGTAAVREFARFLRDNDIPSSAIWSEDWRGGSELAEGYRLHTDWWLNTATYPDFDRLLADLSDDGFAFQAYFNTFVYENSDVYPEAIEGGHCIMRRGASDGAAPTPWRFQGPAGGFPNACLADLTNPDTRAWVRGYLVRALQLGIRGWMADYGEWQPIDDAILASGEDPALAHNHYPILWQQINEEAVREAGLEGQVGIFYRSGFLGYQTRPGSGIIAETRTRAWRPDQFRANAARIHYVLSCAVRAVTTSGSQPLATVIWAGDQRTSFDPDDGLPTIVPIGLGLAATGFPFYTHDVAGYQSTGNPPATKELFFRWTELAALTPVMRTHHGIAARDNWNLRSDAASTAHWRRYAALHIRLYPYLRALALRARDEGRPLWILSRRGAEPQREGTTKHAKGAKMATGTSVYKEESYLRLLVEVTRAAPRRSCARTCPWSRSSSPRCGRGGRGQTPRR
jgi:sulfoquinovosidase